MHVGRRHLLDQRVDLLHGRAPSDDAERAVAVEVPAGAGEVAANGLELGGTVVEHALDLGVRARELIGAARVLRDQLGGVERDRDLVAERLQHPEIIARERRRRQPALHVQRARDRSMRANRQADDLLQPEGVHRGGAGELRVVNRARAHHGVAGLEHALGNRARVGHATAALAERTDGRIWQVAGDGDARVAVARAPRSKNPRSAPVSSTALSMTSASSRSMSRSALIRRYSSSRRNSRSRSGAEVGPVALSLGSRVLVNASCAARGPRRRRRGSCQNAARWALGSGLDIASSSSASWLRCARATAASPTNAAAVAAAACRVHARWRAPSAVTRSMAGPSSPNPLPRPPQPPALSPPLAHQYDRRRLMSAQLPCLSDSAECLALISCRVRVSWFSRFGREIDKVDEQ